MVIRTIEVIQGDKYVVNGWTIFAYNHQEAVEKWLSAVFGKVKINDDTEEHY